MMASIFFKVSALKGWALATAAAVGGLGLSAYKPEGMYSTYLSEVWVWLEFIFGYVFREFASSKVIRQFTSNTNFA